MSFEGPTMLWPLLAAFAFATVDGRLAVRTMRAHNATFIPGTHVVMTDDYEDWTRGRKPVRLYTPGTLLLGGRFPTMVIGGRYPEYLAPGLPNFDPAFPRKSKEAYIPETEADPIGKMCSPGGSPRGHSFYNVWEPEILPMVVDKSTPNRKDVAVIIAPGGGFKHIAWDTDGIGVSQWLNSIGISAFVLKYRVPDSTGGLATQDAQRAVSLVRHHAVEYGLNASRIGFMGFSATGLLGIRLATETVRSYPHLDRVDDQEFRPDFILLLFPFAFDISIADAHRFPTAFIAFTEDDPCCSANRTHELVDTLEKHGNAPVIVKNYPTGGHGWSNCEWYPVLDGKEVCGWKDFAVPFFEQEVLGKR